MTESDDSNDGYLHMHLGVSYLRQINQLVVGDTKELPSTEGFKRLKMRHTVTRRDHRSANGNYPKQPNDNQLPTLARKHQAI